MARWREVEGWPGALWFEAATGRRLLAAPRGLVPHHPYLMDALRPPRPREREDLGGEPRLVLDVSTVLHLDAAIARRQLYCAPWNTYLVLRGSSSDVRVVYLVRTGLRRLLLVDAVAVAGAAGHDVAGWPAEVSRGTWVDQWSFLPPDNTVDLVPPMLPEYLAGPGARP